MDNLGTIGFTEEQVELMDVATNFCRDKSPIDKARALIEDDRGYDADVWREIADLGWLAIAIPEEYDGLGLSLAEVVPIMEQMGRRILAGPFLSATVATQAIVAGGSEAQKSDWLPKLAAGSIATLALAEASGDWNLHNIDAKAENSGNEYTLYGIKQFVTYARDAELIVASVKLDGAVRLALIERGAIDDGAFRREAIIDETKRSFEMVLDGITISADALMDADKSESALAHVDLAANLLQTAEMCGGTQAVIDYTLEYLKTRKQFGKTIGEYQALKHPITDAYVAYEKARSHMFSAAHSFADQGRGEIATRMAKAAADKAYSFAADRAIQFHGGFGFTHECDAQLFRRSAMWNASQFGDAAWHRAKLANLLF